MVNNYFSFFCSHESDHEESNLERLKGAFELMGYVFSNDDQTDTESNMQLNGEVVYRKKHIRLHNRVLKMKHHKPRHTYFDDDGNEVVQSNESKNDTAILHSSSDDDSHIVTIPRPSCTALIMENLNAQKNDQQVVDDLRIQSVEKFIHKSIDQENESICMDDLIFNDDEKSDDVLKDLPSPSVIATASSNSKKEKKKKRKSKLAAILPTEIVNDKSLLKYWYKRFSLFSLFDLGIKLDRGKK